MTILDELLKNIEKSSIDEQVKIICDQIMEEETPKISHYNDKPEGSNIFLTVEFIDKQNYASFLCLERESKETYILSVWSKKNSNDTIKRKNVWIVDVFEPKKIIKFYAEKLKFLRGE